MALTNDIETAKFTFENVFDQAHTLHGDRSSLKQITEEHVGKARQEGYNEGFKAGSNDEELNLKRDINTQLEHLTTSLEEVLGHLAQVEKTTQDQAQTLAMMIARKLVLNLNKIYPTSGLEALIEDSLKQLSAAPHIVIRLSEAQIEPLSEKIKEISAQLGCGDKVMIVPDPEIANSNCRIEWADGGIERDAAEIEAQLEEIFSRYFPGTAHAVQTEVSDETNAVKERDDE